MSAAVPAAEVFFAELVVPPSLDCFPPDDVVLARAGLFGAGGAAFSVPDAVFFAAEGDFLAAAVFLAPEPAGSPVRAAAVVFFLAVLSLRVACSVAFLGVAGFAAAAVPLEGVAAVLLAAGLRAAGCFAVPAFAADCFAAGLFAGAFLAVAFVAVDFSAGALAAALRVDSDFGGLAFFLAEFLSVVAADLDVAALVSDLVAAFFAGAFLLVAVAVFFLAACWVVAVRLVLAAARAGFFAAAEVDFDSA